MNFLSELLDSPTCEDSGSSLSAQLAMETNFDFKIPKKTTIQLKKF
jgi:hypothetical protein